MRVRLVPVLAVLCLAVAACGGDDGVNPPTLEPVTESSPEVAVEVPSAATQATPEGAAEFVRFFYEQLERAYAERDPELIRPLVSPECESCSRVVDAVEQLRAEGARVVDYEVNVVEAEASPLEGGEAAATAVVDFTQFVRVDANGAETDREPAIEGAVYDLVLRQAGDGWQVVSVTRS